MIQGKMNAFKAKQELIQVYRKAVAVVQPDVVIPNSIKFNSRNKHLQIKNSLQDTTISLDLDESHLHILGAGKSALSMAVNLLKVLRPHYHMFKSIDGCLSVPSEQSSRLDSIQYLTSSDIICKFSSIDNKHTKESVDATNSMLNMIDKINSDSSNDEKHRYLFLLSGGASTCLTSPRIIKLEEKQKLVEWVKNKGGIKEVNAVRRYFSNVKAGRLASRILRNKNAKLATIIMSDVVGNCLETIGSGLTFGSDNVAMQREKMLQVLKGTQCPSVNSNDYALRDAIEDIDESLDNTRLQNIIVASNEQALFAAKKEAESLGYDCIMLGSTIEQSCSAFVNILLDMQKNLVKNKIMVIGGGEVNLDVEPNDSFGLGGRCQELAMQYMKSKIEVFANEEAFSVFDMFLAGTSDGQDGPTDVAACVCSYYEWMNDKTKRYTLDDLNRGLRRHDSYNFWTNYNQNALIKTGMTGTNVMDLYFAALYVNTEQ